MNNLQPPLPEGRAHTQEKLEKHQAHTRPCPPLPSANTCPVIHLVLPRSICLHYVMMR
jgi:hypothetical protein